MGEAAASGESVVIKSSRWWLIIPAVVCGVFAYGVFRGLWGLVFDHHDAAKGMSVGEQVAVWVLGVPLGGLAAIGAVVVAAGLFSRSAPTVLDRERLTFPGGTIALAAATAIRYLPGQQTTWSGRTRPGDHSVRGVGRARLQTRLVVEGAGTYCEFSADQRAWPQVVGVLRLWAAARPELVSEESRAFLLRGPTAVVHDLGAPREDPTRRTWGWLVLWGVCSIGVYIALLTLLHRVDSLDGVGDADERHLALVSIPGAVMAGGILALLVAPLLGFVGLAARAVRTGDPWAPFVADDLGRYHPMVSGRMTLLRAGTRRTPTGLAMRWLGLVLPAALPVLLVVELVRLAR